MFINVFPYVSMSCLQHDDEGDELHVMINTQKYNHFCNENIMIWPIMNYQLLTYFKIIIRNIPKQDILRKKYPYNCFVMTMYQSLLMALVSLPFCVLESWALKK